jgi:endonuclease/exonuclease/phosphatase family metal-dependent hydrolase
MLQEVARVKLVSWFGERLQLPYQYFAVYPGTRKGGIALLSRWPLGPQRILHFRHSKQAKVALAAQVQTPAGSLWACSVHLDAPRKEDFGSNVLQQSAFAWGEFFMASVRYRQAQELRAWLTELADGAWIVAGDFNSMPFSSADRYFSRYFDDAFLQRPWRYFTGTFWDLPQVPVRPRIDYIYHSPRFWVRDVQVIQEKLSDHFPVLAVLAPITDLPAAVASGTLAAQAHHPPP